LQIGRQVNRSAFNISWLNNCQKA